MGFERYINDPFYDFVETQVQDVQPFNDYGVYDSFSSSSGSSSAGGGGGSSGGAASNSVTSGSDLALGDVISTEDFVITINGTQPGEDTIVVPSSCKIDCNGGTVFAGTPLNPGDEDDKAEAPDATAKSAEFSLSETTTFGVYCEVAFETFEDDLGVVRIKRLNSATIKINEIDSAKYVDRKVNIEEQLYAFTIGTVQLTRQNGRNYVKVSQVHAGPHYMKANVTKEGSILGGSGPLQFTFCINGEPYTGFLDVDFIQKV